MLRGPAPPDPPWTTNFSKQSEQTYRFVYTTHARPAENDLNLPMNVETSPACHATAADEAHLKALVKFTALSFKTPRPVPFGALIVDSKSGEMLLRARTAAAGENDPSS